MDYRYEIDQILAYWQPILDLENWDIRIGFTEAESVACCLAKPQYLTAMLDFNLARLGQEIKTRPELEELVLHELVHARLWALANVLPDLDTIPNRFLEYYEEEAVSQVTNALLRARNGQKRTGSEVRHVAVAKTGTEVIERGSGEPPVSSGIY